MSQSTHRLPTITGSDALQEAKGSKSDRSIKLGPKTLDALLCNRDQREDDEQRGIPQGELTEIIGPPGVGKTALCLQATAATLLARKAVIWIDTATAVSATRLGALLSQGNDADCLSRFRHYTAPTLSHVVALLLHPPSGSLSDAVGLIVVDSLSASLDSEYPRGSDDTGSTKNDTTRWGAGRRQATISDIGNWLAKLAAVHDVAVMIVSNTVTHIRAGSEASLRPALVGKGWESSVANRIYLYRDWLPVSETANPRKTFEAARIAVRLESSSDSGTQGQQARPFAAFRIVETGFEELDIDTTSAMSASPERLLSRESRKRDRTDSDESSQEYGWDEEDELAAEGLVDASFI